MPKIGVHAIILNDVGNILLVKKNYLDHDWVPPGGMMEENESINDTAIREVLEETGYLIEVKELIALASRKKTNDVIIVLSAIIIKKMSSQINPEEISKIDFSHLDSLPTPMKPEVIQLIELYKSGQRGKLIIL